MHPSHHWNYHWHWYLLDALLDSERSRLDWGIAHALGARICPLILWVVHLARVRDDVSSEWWGKGLPGGGLSKTEIPCYDGVCFECHIV